MLLDHEGQSVDELIDRLPATIVLSRIPEVLGVGMDSVYEAIARRTLVTIGTGRRRRMRCAESRPFLAEVVSRSTPEPSGPHVDRARSVSLTVSVPESAFARLRTASERRRLPVDELVVEMLTAAFGGS